MSWYREIGGIYEKGNKFGRKVFVPFNEDLHESIKRFGPNPIDKYCTLYSYNSVPQSEALMYGSFYLDFDSENYEKAKADIKIVFRVLREEFGLSENEYKIYFSGSKGFHIIINPATLGLLPKKLLNVDFKKIAMYIKSKTIHKTVDTGIYDTVRLFRIPNTINGKSGLYKIRIRQEDVENLSYEKMKAKASSPTEDNKVVIIHNTIAIAKYKEIIETEEKEELPRERKDMPRQQTGELLPCILSILEHGADKGTRNNTALVLSSALFQAKDNLKEVMDLMLEWNECMNTYPLSETELRTTVMSAYRRYRGGQSCGCKSVRELGYCLQQCPLNRGK